MSFHDSSRPRKNVKQLYMFILRAYREELIKKTFRDICANQIKKNCIIHHYPMIECINTVTVYLAQYVSGLFFAWSYSDSKFRFLNFSDSVNRKVINGRQKYCLTTNLLVEARTCFRSAKFNDLYWFWIMKMFFVLSSSRYKRLTENSLNFI